MIYVMSDIHGEYEKYLQMLEKIAFSEDDTLYVLGDAIDRGPEPIKVLQDMSSRDNVFILMGNHEAMASYVLHKLNVEITEENAETHIDAVLMQAIVGWQRNGGDVTMKQFRNLSPEDRADLLEYIDEAPWYDVVDVRNRTFILVHSGLGNFEHGKRLSQYSFDEMLATKRF